MAKTEKKVIFITPPLLCTLLTTEFCVQESLIIVSYAYFHTTCILFRNKTKNILLCPNVDANIL